MRLAPALLAFAAAALAPPSLARAVPPPARALHLFAAVALSPDGRHVASIETDDVAAETDPPVQLLIRDLAGGVARVALPCAGRPGCVPSSPSWSADGRQLAFLLEQPDGATTTIESVGADGGPPRRVLAFPGPLSGLRRGPDDRLAVLAIPHARKRAGATQAAAPLQGEVGADPDEQRIGVVEHAGLRLASPPGLYVYEFDWRPDGGFVATAAPGDGDSQWWVARLWAFEPQGAARVLFAPGPREQLAAPSVSPDGRSVAFIGGWMSDFGSTGGDAFLLALPAPADTALHAAPDAGADAPAPVNLTPGLHASVTAIDWRCGDTLTAVLLDGASTAVAALAAGQAPRTLWSGERLLSAEGHASSLSCSGHGLAAAVSQSFAAPPELVAGPIGAWRTLTHANQGLAPPGTARSITWRSDGLDVQGWLLEPATPASHDPGLTPPGSAALPGRPLIVSVHGGPQAAALPVFASTRSTIRALLDQGWAVIEPNYRGSLGAGEAFATASIGDLGGGDWRDVLASIDAAARATPIDERRVGITGGSYGGYMAMWAVTQTRRFAAGVAVAGVSDWLSIEGEAPQAGSDAVSFGGSVYDNPEPYLRASPITHMPGTATPVLLAVGDRDVECPLPQSQEFHTALQALGVPTSLVVYKDEGHAFRREADRDDLRRRTLAWFHRFFRDTP
jgi:dipeptidyl aminopeptidase/acylaminoacyl peptidase